MAMYKRCKRCGTLVEGYKGVCEGCIELVEKDKQQAYRLYDNTDSIRKMRHSKEWKKLREEVIETFGGLCAKCLVEEKLVPFDHVHHIVYAENDESLFFDKNNLVCLCEKHHREVHKHRIKGLRDFELYLESK